MQVQEDEHVDSGRRTWLIAASVAGGVGGLAAVVPFAGSFAPSEKAKAAGAPVEVDIGNLKPGEMMTVAWRGKPVWIFNRTDQMLADVQKADSELADPHIGDTDFGHLRRIGFPNAFGPMFRVVADAEGGLHGGAFRDEGKGRRSLLEPIGQRGKTEG